MRLLVIGQVDVVGVSTLSTRNRSLNIILNEYARHFDKLAYFGPNKPEQDSVDLVDAEFFGSRAYIRTLFGRAAFMLSSRVLREIDETISVFQPDLIQIRVPGPFTLKIGTYLKRRHAKRMFCYVAGDISESLAANFPYPGVSWIAEAMARWQDRLLRGLPVVTAGDALRRVLLQRNGEGLRCHAYYSTTHQDVYRSSKRANELLVVGRLEPLKRPHLALEALKLLHERGHVDYTLRFLGEGPEQQTLAKQVSRLGLERHVIFHGYERDSEALRRIYLQAKFLLHPSATEGTSKVLAEAMAHGVVPIAIRGVGSNDQILARNSTLLISPNAADFSDIIARASADALYWKTLQETGYSYAEEHTISLEVEELFRWLFASIETSN